MLKFAIWMFAFAVSQVMSVFPSPDLGTLPLALGCICLYPATMLYITGDLQCKCPNLKRIFISCLPPPPLEPYDPEEICAIDHQPLGVDAEGTFFLETNSQSWKTFVLKLSYEFKIWKPIREFHNI